GLANADLDDGDCRLGNFFGRRGSFLWLLSGAQSRGAGSDRRVAVRVSVRSPTVREGQHWNSSSSVPIVALPYGRASDTVASLDLFRGKQTRSSLDVHLDHLSVVVLDESERRISVFYEKRSFRLRKHL